MTLLSIVQTAAPRFGIQAPNAAASSTDQNVQQIVAFVNEEGQELGSQYNWQALTREATFVTLAAETQGAITTLAGADFDSILNETLWNRTQQRPVFGPKSPQQWQQLKAQFSQGPWQQYRLRGNNLMFTPAPSAGQNVYFEWITRNWATDTTGATGKSAMTVDTDLSLLPERLLTLGAIWRFKAAKKLDYSQDFQKYQEAVDTAVSKDASKPKLSLNGPDIDIFPVVLVAAGNWGIP